MKVLFDISVLGVGHAKPSARAGIFRFAETLLEVLSRRTDIELALVAECNQVDCVRYLREAAPPGISALPLHVDPVTTLLLGLERRFDKAWQAPLRTACDILRVTWIRSGIRLNGGIWREAAIYQTPHFMHWPRRFPEQFQGRPLVIHYDLIPILHPEWFDGPETSALRDSLGGPVRDWHSISISESTTRDLVEHAGLAPARIHTVWLAADTDRFHTRTTDRERAEIRARLGFGDAPFILALNTLEPRKNVEGAVQAFAAIAERPGMEKHRLVLAGARGWKTDAIEAALVSNPGLKDRIVLAGYVPDHLLAALYSEATVFVYLSWYEGFGLPPLEAMACGTPVLSSNTSSLPEVVGDAGVLVDPHRPDLVAEALADLLGDPELRRRYSRAGLSRASLFSWERTADGVVSAWRSAVGP